MTGGARSHPDCKFAATGAGHPNPLRAPRLAARLEAAPKSHLKKKTEKPDLMSATGQNKIRIRLKSYDQGTIETAAKEIVETAEGTGAKVTGPVPLPTDKSVYCVIRSPFKDKDSREHFEIRTHKRLIDIHKSTPKTVDSLQRLDLPAGVDIEIKLAG